MKSYRDIAAGVAEKAKDWMHEQNTAVSWGKTIGREQPATAKDIRKLMGQLHEYLMESMFENCEHHEPLPPTGIGTVYCSGCGKHMAELEGK